MHHTTTLDLNNCARASAQNLSISTKHCIEISRMLRYKTTDAGKKMLGEVVELQRAVPFRRFRRNVGHKAGMSSGRYPQKAARQFLKLLQAVESNAQVKGLDTHHLKIVRILSNRAAIPQTGGRQRYGTKRTHLEVMVQEVGKKGGKKDSVEEIKKSGKKESQKESQKEERKEMPSPEKISPVQSRGQGESVYSPKTAVESRPAEPSSADLLRQAQAKAAALHQKEQVDKETAQVASLLGKLQQKGTLRT